MSALIRRCRKLTPKGYLSIEAKFDRYDIDGVRDEVTWSVYHEKHGASDGATPQAAWDRFRTNVKGARTKSNPSAEAAKVDVRGTQ